MHTEKTARTLIALVAFLAGAGLVAAFASPGRGSMQLTGTTVTMSSLASSTALPPTLGTSTTDLGTLTTLLMLERTGSIESSLTAMAASQQARNQRLSEIRAQMADLRSRMGELRAQIDSAAPGQYSSDELANMQLSYDELQAESDTLEAEASALQAAAEAELAEMQAMMARYQQMVELTSNLLANMNQTLQTIVTNLR
jgi:uncharacterized protein (DUF3084 family)